MRRKGSGWGTWHLEGESVIACVPGCSEDHEHYTGSYADACVWFTGGLEAADAADHTGDLMNVLRWYQLNDQTSTRTSAELYDLLMQKAASEKYWINPEKRSEAVISVIVKAADLFLIKDVALAESFRRSEKSSAEKRLWKLERFLAEHPELPAI